MDIDRLALLRSVPARVATAGSSRLRAGNLVGGPAGEITTPAEGLIDFGCRCTFVRQDTTGLERRAREASWLARHIAGLAGKLMTGDFLYPGHIHLAGVADLATADKASPHGVRPPIAGRGSELEEVRFHAWLTTDHLPIRISTEHLLPFPAGERFWSAVEFWDYGVLVDQAWEPEINQLLSSTSPNVVN